MKNIPIILAGTLLMNDPSFNLKKGPRRVRKIFSPEEDSKLTEIMNKQKFVSWDKVAKEIATRTARQCRDRWLNYLSPAIRRDPWTRKEDILLVDKINEYGTHWSQISKFFTGRSDNHIKNRWYSYLKNRVRPDEMSGRFVLIYEIDEESSANLDSADQTQTQFTPVFEQSQNNDSINHQNDFGKASDHNTNESDYIYTNKNYYSDTTIPIQDIENKSYFKNNNVLNIRNNTDESIDQSFQNQYNSHYKNHDQFKYHDPFSTSFINRNESDNYNYSEKSTSDVDENDNREYSSNENSNENRNENTKNHNLCVFSFNESHKNSNDAFSDFWDKHLLNSEGKQRSLFSRNSTSSSKDSFFSGWPLDCFALL
ncbi:hypothetical protein TRFO_12959 [Tritrichomonas foetus]|uniref:Myb-like DNA-binding domain containing protein n=1 Tax=Tritrichomonas foetus TaxID=1144522 RepID=A0A1J4KZM0_9EUKA|nr:hypothetical protein TRFO_12959 [Tritrichomonas foetus]|eukprot:OHT16705.1 hypothetical protein TRFO_12959 [Tritrichomonas foetus]